MQRGSVDGRSFETRTVGRRPSRAPGSGTDVGPKYKILRSRWMILVNTNTDYNKDQTLPFDETMNCLERAANDLINQENEIVRAGILKCFNFDPNARRSLVTPSIETPRNPYQNGKLSQVFEAAPGSNYLHQHIDLTLDHVYGDGAIALQLNNKALYNYIAGRLLHDTGQDFTRAGRKLFIRIRRIPANMMKSYFAKGTYQSEEDARRFEMNQLRAVPWLREETLHDLSTVRPLLQ